ncbi:MAG TPA: undecaprenyldiphospho-muramoylpentapeptide beta-N-acetylglucosaminyltransferase [Firmicutes bacterium]|nr:undecaprenyldiphospho-muramoylpentapeptide beta-N-acetylglucosaminyltransferase [Bacillota bacterium]
MGEVRIVIVAAGTGGHIYPGLAIGQALRERVSADISFIGRPNSPEQRAITQQGYAFHAIKAQALPRKLSLGFVSSGALLAIGTLKSIGLLRRLKPKVIVSIGGFVAVPVTLAARLLRIPLVLHEPNALPGLANRLMARHAAVTMLSFPGAVKYLPPSAKVVVTGTPIRPEIVTTTKDEGRKALGIPPGKKLLLVVGGSQGAKSINDAMEQAAPLLAEEKELMILHQTGPTHFAAVREAFGGSESRVVVGNRIIVPYIQEMPLALAAADLIVCRAGAVTLAEVTAVGLPAVVIPYPFAAEDHQRKNALELVNAGAATLIDDGELTGETLARAVLEIYRDPAKATKMAQASKNLGRPQALQEIAEIILNLM